MDSCVQPNPSRRSSYIHTKLRITVQRHQSTDSFETLDICRVPTEDFGTLQISKFESLKVQHDGTYFETSGYETQNRHAIWTGCCGVRGPRGLNLARWTLTALGIIRVVSTHLKSIPVYNHGVQRHAREVRQADIAPQTPNCINRDR